MGGRMRTDWITVQDGITGEWLAVGEKIREVFELPRWNIGRIDPWRSCHPEDAPLMREVEHRIHRHHQIQASFRYRIQGLRTGTVRGLHGVSYRLQTARGMRDVVDYRVVAPAKARTTRDRIQWIMPVRFPGEVCRDLAALAAGCGLVLGADELATLVLKSVLGG